MFKSMQERSGEVPAPLLAMPKLEDVDAFYYNIYKILVRSRTIGMAEYYIPIGQMSAYLNELLIFDPDERLEIIGLMTTLDAEMLSHDGEKRKAEQAAKK